MAMSQRVMGEILEAFFRGSDQSRYGFMNAITSAARDRSDPDERWNLEELGGGVAANVFPASPHDMWGSHAELARVG